MHWIRGQGRIPPLTGVPWPSEVHRGGTLKRGGVAEDAKLSASEFLSSPANLQHRVCVKQWNCNYLCHSPCTTALAEHSNPQLQLCYCKQHQSNFRRTTTEEQQQRELWQGSTLRELLEEEEEEQSPLTGRDSS